MEKVKLTYKYRETLNDMDVIQHTTAYRVDEKYIATIDKKKRRIRIKPITAETDDGVYIDEDNQDEYPIFITLENIDDIDITDHSVVNFIKHLIKVRKNQSDY
jgi:phage repressor protein C with HTH and peptisase S24 domain